MPRLPRRPPILRSTQAPISFSMRLWMTVGRKLRTRARRRKGPATIVACSWREFYHGLLRWIPNQGKLPANLLPDPFLTDFHNTDRVYDAIRWRHGQPPLGH